MAEAKVKNVLTKISKGHLECPICCGRFNDPKILDCLHSFCLNCLDEFVRGQDPEKDKIACPVCRRETNISTAGLKDLPNCFFLSSLVDEVTEQERALDDTPRPTLTCEECEEGLEAVSRCFDCEENICQKCQEAHRNLKYTRNHRIVSLNDLTKIGASLKESKKANVPRCHKHPDQEASFYCDTCESLTCARCVAVDHRTDEHKCGEITESANTLRKDVQAAAQRFEKSRQHVKEMEESIKHARNRFQTMVTKACRDISDKEEEEIAKIRNKARLLKEKLKQISQDREREYEKEHVSNCEKIERAEQVMAAVKDLVHQADDFELLGLKAKVMHNLQLTEDHLLLEPAQHNPSFIGVKCNDVVDKKNLGDVLCEEKWKFKAQFGKQGTGKGQFKLAAFAGCFSNGDIVVTDKIYTRASVFTSDGHYKTTVGQYGKQKQLKQPFGVAVTRDDLLVVGDGNTVKVFDANLKMTHQFTPSQSKVSNSKLASIAVDKTKRIAVTDPGRKVITLHYLDGSLIATMANDMLDDFMAISDKERLIFTNYNGCRLLCVDFRGNELFNIGISIGGKSVHPAGVCCDDVGDIYVSVHTGDYKLKNRVLHYTAQGEYVGVSVDGLMRPMDLTFTPRGDLVVTDQSSVKIFHRV